MNKKLLVEGKDDRSVVSALCKKCGIHENFEIVDCQGVDNLMSRISVTFKISGIETVGIIIDADENLQSRWDSLKNILLSTDFKAPQILPETGLILEKNSKKTGVWIMPNNNANGRLEDFISFLIPPEDELLPVVHSKLDYIETRKLNKYSETHKSKAIIHTWLAWQKDPCTPMGASITKKYLSADDTTCRKFVQWLNNLFK
jgi:hypothetical protein